MRGSRIYTTLFTESIESRHKGRSKELNSKRNECLMDRFYFYGKYSDKRYEAIINILSREFFLTEKTIIQAIETNSRFLTALKNEKLPKNHFTKKWPHLNW